MDELKSAWQAMPERHKSQTVLQGMLKEGRHPVLKDLRRQVLIEGLFFTAFLGCYYTMFDGDRRPLWLNALLIAGMLLMIGHGWLGYRNSRRAVAGNDLRQALRQRVGQLKTFAVLSVALRVMGTACMLLYFTWVISFTMEKQVLLWGLMAVLLIQLGLLAGLWARRIKRLQQAVGTLSDQ